MRVRICAAWLVSLIFWTAVEGADAPRKADKRILNALNATEWIYGLDSARIDATIRVTRPPETVELNKKRFVKELRDIGVEVTDEIPENIAREQAGFRETTVASLVLAWNRHRVAYRYDLPECFRDVAIWDGLQGRRQQKWGTRQNSFALLPQPPNSEYFFLNLPWAASAHHCGPLQVDADAVRQAAVQRAENRRTDAELRLHSIVKFAGVDCELFAHPTLPNWERFYVDHATCRLRGFRTGSWGTVYGAIVFPIVQEALKDRQIAVTSQSDSDAAVQKWPAAEQQKFWDALSPRTSQAYWEHLPDLDPIWTVTLDDWREVLPGHWFPFRQESHTHAGGSSRPTGEEHLVSTVDHFDVNQPLDEALFALEIDEGADVYDATHNPPLRYKQDSHRTPEEWSALIAKARESQASDQAEQAALEALIGSAAPDFPKSTWLNTEPLTWQQLSGKYVLLDFWHIGCGPCWAYIPWLQSIHENQSADGRLVVIGVHGAGVAADTVRSELANRLKTDPKFPICIDQPLETDIDTETYSSHFFHHFAIRRMPYAWLIGPDGKLIAHGDLPTLHTQARELMRGPNSKK